MFAQFLLLKKHHGFIRYFKNTSWMMAEQLLRIVAGLFVGIWVVRYMGPEQFGLFNYVISFTVIFSGIAKLGLDSILVRELVNNQEKKDVLLGSAFWLKFSGAIFAVGLIFVTVPFTSNNEKTNAFIFIVASGMVFQSFEVIEFNFQSQVLAKIISICKVVQLSLSSIIKISLIITNKDLVWFVLVTSFDAMSLAVAYVVAYKFQKNNTFYKHFDLETAKLLLKSSWHLIFYTITVVFYIKIDQIMIKEMLGIYEVGQYSAGIRLAEALFFIPIIIVTSLFPAILNAKKTSHDLYKKRLIRLFSFLILISILILIILKLTARQLILKLFGIEYSSASSVLEIYSFSLPFVFLAVASSRWLIAENLNKNLLSRSLIAALINIGLNYSLIPVYGINGSAISTVITYIYISLIHDLFNTKTRILLKYKISSTIFWRY